ncbi:MAG: hypothetical protein FWG85_05910 [Bacteroidetes bacterium]|nr:hypothetical protein [Bacteroidota bacterium]
MQQEDLLVQIDALKEQLLHLLTIWYKSQTELLQEILFLYENIFGNIETEIEQKEQNAKKLEQKFKILSTYLENNEPVKRQSIEFIDKLLFNNDNTKFKKQNTYTNPKNYFIRRDINKKLDTTANDKIDIVSIYRHIVKKLHPDIIQESNIFKLCWANVQFCYQNQDAERLKMFYLILCGNYEGNIKIEALINEINQLKDYIEKQHKDNEYLQTQEPYCFKDKLSNEHWIIERKNTLRNKLVQVNKRITHNNRLLRQIKIVD